MIFKLIFTNNYMIILIHVPSVIITSKHDLHKFTCRSYSFITCSVKQKYLLIYIFFSYPQLKKKNKFTELLFRNIWLRYSPLHNYQSA